MLSRGSPIFFPTVLSCRRTLSSCCSELGRKLRVLWRRYPRLTQQNGMSVHQSNGFPRERDGKGGEEGSRGECSPVWKQWHPKLTGKESRNYNLQIQGERVAGGRRSYQTNCNAG